MKNVFAAGLSALILSTSTAAFSASNCATSEELRALDARVIQSNLMVGALACKQQVTYNAFVKKFQPELIKRSSSMQSYFKRVYGSAATNQLNRFVTNLANSASSTSLNMHESQFCGNIQKAFEVALSSSTRDLSALTDTGILSTSHGVESCKAVAQN